MRIFDIISKKRHKKSLTRDEIQFAIDGYLNGTIADYQMSSLLMAICINSMNEEETYNLTDIMIKSGDVVDLSPLGGKTVDKHSTGGVGDKTTLIVAPICASLGCIVAKMSGRGLGFTGGTIDKLESIEGFKTELSMDSFLNQSKNIGLSVISQSGNLAPADKKLYALRDVSGTIDSIPLIASSIMSKKIASGAKNIVLDVKVGSGAFMKSIEEARELAVTMIKIGKGFGRSVCALITNMDMPLGFSVGNSLELYEAIQVLKCKGEKRLTEVCIALATQMVSMSLCINKNEALSLVKDSLESGSAYKKLEEWIISQGGKMPLEKELLSAKYKVDYLAKDSGYISKIYAEGVGISAMTLGAGRQKKEDKIDHLVGLFFKKSYGDYVNKGEKIATVYANDLSTVNACTSTLDSSITICENKPNEQELIFQIID